MDQNEIILKIKNRFSKSRWEHILGVRETALDLAAINGADQEKTALAALLHDYGKTLTGKELIAKAKELGLMLCEDDYLCPDLLHGPVGALLVKEDLNISDEEILQSIASHTLGSEAMSMLDKIIFLADMIEPTRDYPGVEELRRQVYYDLDKGLLNGFNQTINHVIALNGIIHTRTIVSRNALLKDKVKQELSD